MIRSVFGFRTRHPDRDRQTDADRLQRVLDTLAAISLEIERERAGLEKRYGTVSADAAFLLEAIENEEGPRRDSARIGELTDNLQACERRMAALGKQLLFMEECRRSVERFGEDNAITGAPSSSGTPAYSGGA